MGIIKLKDIGKTVIEVDKINMFQKEDDIISIKMIINGGKVNAYYHYKEQRDDDYDRLLEGKYK